MDSSIGLPIGISGALIIAIILFWYTYRNQVEPYGGRGSEDQLAAERSARIRQEIEIETHHNSKNNEEIEEIFGD